MIVLYKEVILEGKYSRLTNAMMTECFQVIREYESRILSISTTSNELF